MVGGLRARPQAGGAETRRECTEPTQAWVTSSPQLVSPGSGGGWEAGGGWRRQTEGWRSWRPGPPPDGPPRDGLSGAASAVLCQPSREGGAPKFPSRAVRQGLAFKGVRCQEKLDSVALASNPGPCQRSHERVTGPRLGWGRRSPAPRPGERVESLARSRHSPRPTPRLPSSSCDPRASLQACT